MLRRLLSGRTASPALTAAVMLVCFVVSVGAATYASGASSRTWAAAALALLAVWLLLSDRYRLTLAVLLLYLGLLDGYLKLSSGSSAVTLIRDVLLYAIVIGALVRISVRRTRLEIPPLTGLLAGFAAIVLAQILNPGTGSLGHGLAAVRPHLEFAPLFFFGYVLMRSKRDLRVFLLLLLLVAAVNGIVTLLQLNLTPDQLASWGPGYRSRVFGGNGLSGRTFFDTAGVARVRPLGLGADTGVGGQFGLLAICGTIALLGVRSYRWATPVVLLLGAGTVAAVVASQTRSAVVGTVVALFVFTILAVVSRRLVPLLAGMLAAGAVTLLVISAVTGSSSTGTFDRYASIAPGRVVSTSLKYRGSTLASIPDLTAQFPVGAGLGSAGPAAGFGSAVAKDVNAESEYTFLIIELGVPGLLLWCALALTVAGWSFRRIRLHEDPELRLLLAAVAAPFVAQLVVGANAPISAVSPGGPFFWFAGGVLTYWLGSRPGRATADAAV